MNKYVRKYLLDSEEVFDFSHQRKYFGVYPLFPRLLVMSNRRILFITPKFFGCEFQDVLWINVQNIMLKEYMLTSTIMCKLLNGELIVMNGLSKEEALRLYKTGQKLEEQMLEYRRQLELDKNRAGASNIILNNADSVSALPSTPLTQMDTREGVER